MKKLKKETSVNRKPALRQKQVLKKGDVARKRILEAAREVFSKHPYNAASIRMVAKAGNFDHPLIHYYFPTKARLFEAVIEDLYEKFSEFVKGCYDGLELISPRAGLALFIDRYVEFFRGHPAALKILMQNIAQIDTAENSPGLKYIPVFHTRFRKSFEKKVRLKAASEEVERFVYSFSALANNYLGAGNCYALALGMHPESAEYSKWVKDTLLAVFVPPLTRMIFAEKYREISVEKNSGTSITSPL
jgi:TetR/AcrR family transcriptional regulator